MRNMNSLEVLMVAPVATSAGVYLTMVGGYLDGMRRRGVSARESEVCPRVSILKPLAGLDDELLENLESFTQLDYPDYEILIGIASREDKAYPVARRFVETWGDRARLVITNPDEALNPKVAQLLSLERAATGEVLVIADSNVRVTSQYLRPMLAELSRPKVALTSSVIAGTGEQSLGAALENLQLGALVAPSVVASAHLAGQVMTIGKSMAMWRRALGDIGGFARVANLLSEDHMLGQAFALAGHKVTVSLAPVCNRNVACSLGRTVERHTRWAKLRRLIEPAVFAMEPLLSPLVIATLALLVHPCRASSIAFLAAVALQTIGATVTTHLLRGTPPRWYWAPLEIVRSYVLFFCWLRACVSRRVSWRGHDFELARDSLIVPAEPSVWSRVRALVRA